MVCRPGIGCRIINLYRLVELDFDHPSPRLLSCRAIRCPYEQYSSMPSNSMYLYLDHIPAHQKYSKNCYRVSPKIKSFHSKESPYHGDKAKEVPADDLQRDQDFHRIQVSLNSPPMIYNLPLMAPAVPWRAVFSEGNVVHWLVA